jgi:hypothetical protein
MSDTLNSKSEIRISKSETNSKYKAQMIKAKGKTRPGLERAHWLWLYFPSLFLSVSPCLCGAFLSSF